MIKVSSRTTAAMSGAGPPIFSDNSVSRARELRDLALMELDHLPGRTDTLEWLAAYSVDRDR